MYRSLGTLRDLLADLSWPDQHFAPDLPDFLDRVYVLDYELDTARAGFSGTIWLAFEGELSLRMPGVAGVRLVVGADLPGFTFITASLTFGDESELILHNLSLALRFDPSLLKPGGSAGQPTKEAEIRVVGTLRIDRSFHVSASGVHVSI